MHVPDLVFYGSKPRREILKNPQVKKSLAGSLRSFEAAVRYPANQTYVGNLTPAQLGDIPRPWYRSDQKADGNPEHIGPFGEIVSQDKFYAILERANVITPALVELTPAARDGLIAAVGSHPVLSSLIPTNADTRAAGRRDPVDGTTLMLRTGDDLKGYVHRDERAEGREDPNLDAATLLEGLCVKASGAIALQWLLHRAALDPGRIDYVISCGEEAAGDRYQRGAGGMAKSIAEMCGCLNASGMDVKNFCAGPASALVTAGAMVKAGLYERVAVVAGGSLAKLGMKFEAFLDLGMPILDDCLGATAFLVTKNDGISPIFHLEPGTIGLATIGASTSDQAVYKKLILDPLAVLNLRMTDIDKYAPELHNPEVMEHSGSGDVVHKNYRIIAALAVMAGEISKSEMDQFITRIGMVGFAPTQGHIPSAVPYMAHAIAAMAIGSLNRAMFLCKASLFLNRLTELYDGVSFLLEANPNSHH